MIWFSRQSTASQGILFVMISVSFFSLMDAVAKQLGLVMDVSQILWARYFGQLVIVLILCRKRTIPLLQTSHLGLQVLRALTQLSAAACFFIALKNQGLAEATAVADVAPVLITITAALILGEKIGLRRILGIAAALLGAMIIIRPGSDVFTLASLWPLGTAASLAVFSIITRHIGPTESPLTALLYSGIICAAIMCIIAPFRWTSPTLISFAMMIGVGAIGTMGQLMMIKAYAVAPASVVAPFTYAGLLAATLWGILFFDQWPDMWTCVGALVVVAAGLYVWHRETRATRSTQISEQT
jgi:drug/metabolite transporter (DMT)-like permease